MPRFEDGQKPKDEKIICPHCGEEISPSKKEEINLEIPIYDESGKLKSEEEIRLFANEIRKKIGYVPQKLADNLQKAYKLRRENAIMLEREMKNEKNI